MPHPTPTPEDLREAIRDLTGILRAMWRAEEPGSLKRPAIVEAGKRLTELAALLDQPGSEAYERATKAADIAVNNVFRSLHFNAPLAPVLSYAAGRAILSRRR